MVKISQYLRSIILELLGPFVSILIPAYERADYLRRALDSIASQRYRNLEVIVTDDSTTDAVENLVRRLNYDLPIRYERNRPALGTPRNWTAGLKVAKGEWIKILHDDDWFSSPDSLSNYVNAIEDGVDILFSGYTAVYEDTGMQVNKTLSPKRFDRLVADPFLLCAGNLIGPPSVMMFRRAVSVSFDPQLKWIVDWEGYIRMMQVHRAGYIARPLINMSYNATQVTNLCFGDPKVEIPEYLIFYAKHGDRARSGWRVYDAWWRLIRNLSIRSGSELAGYASGHPVPDFLRRIVRHQRILPIRLWRFGIVSKFGMTLSYLINQ